MNERERLAIKNIVKHVTILNDEVGKLQMDVRWIKRVVYYLAGLVSVAVGRILFYG